MAPDPMADTRAALDAVVADPRAALETPAASNLRAPTRPMARRPHGERKDALDTVVEHK